MDDVRHVGRSRPLRRVFLAAILAELSITRSGVGAGSLRNTGASSRFPARAGSALHAPFSGPCASPPCEKHDALDHETDDDHRRQPGEGHRAVLELVAVLENEPAQAAGSAKEDARTTSSAAIKGAPSKGPADLKPRARIEGKRPPGSGSASRSGTPRQAVISGRPCAGVLGDRGETPRNAC